MVDIALRRLRAVVKGYPSQAAAARALGLSPQFLNGILKGHKRMPDGLLEKLGFVRRTVVEAR